MIKTIVTNDNKTIQIDVAEIRPEDTIIVTLDPNIYNVQVAQDFSRNLASIFPYNYILIKFKGLDIDVVSN